MSDSDCDLMTENAEFCNSGAESSQFLIEKTGVPQETKRNPGLCLGRLLVRQLKRLDSISKTFYNTREKIYISYFIRRSSTAAIRS